MKRILILLSLVTSSFASAENILNNSKFDSPLVKEIPDAKGYVDTRNSWIKFENSGGVGKIQIENGVLVGKSHNLNAPIHGLQLIQSPLKIEAGGIYKVKFSADVKEKTLVAFKLGANAKRGYYAYWYKEIELIPGKKEYEYKFEMLAEGDNEARFEVCFTKANEEVKIDNVELEKIGNIETERMINLTKFNTQKEYLVGEVGKNLLTEKELDSINKNKKIVKKLALEQEGRYKFKIDGELEENDYFLVGFSKKDLKRLDKKNKEIVLVYNEKTKEDGEIIIEKYFLTKNDIKISLEKDCGKLVWYEEFNYEGAPSPKDWDYEIGGHGWGNSEKQYYTKDNVKVKNGKLIITAKKEKKDKNDYTSTRLVSRGKKELLYGRVEVKAKLPKGRGTWPAIWMMPSESVYGEWPKSGEIDIMEHVGHDEGVVHGTVHNEKYYWVKSNQKGNQIKVKGSTEEFHVYALEWTPNLIKIYKDDTLYFIYENEKEGIKSWPYNKKFYLILNIAVGGSWGGQQGIDDKIFPQNMEIDYIKFYDMGLKGE